MNSQAAKVYLASRYTRFNEMQDVKKYLHAIGIIVTSRWIEGTHQITDKELSDELKVKEKTRFALEDYEDLLNADIVISFTEEPRQTQTRGGRHIELGIALGTKKRCIVIGPRENVFHCLPQIEWFPTLEHFKLHFNASFSCKQPFNTGRTLHKCPNCGEEYPISNSFNNEALDASKICCNCQSVMVPVQ